MRDSTSSGTAGCSDVVPASLLLNTLLEEKNMFTSWRRGFNIENRKYLMCTVVSSPCGLSGEEQRVGFKGHGAVCGGWGFGKDQTDQCIQATVARQGIATAEQPSGEAQQGGEEELKERDGEKS